MLTKYILTEYILSQMELKISRKEQKERTRQRLIDSATQLFSTLGIASTNTANIADSVGVSHGTLFVHFPTREDLILAVMNEFGSQLSEEFNQNLKTKSVKAVLSSHLKILAEYEDFYFRLLSEINSLNPKIKGLFFMLNAAVSCKLYEAALPQIKSGEIKKIDQPNLFNTWMALLSYKILNRELFSMKTPILKEMGEDLINNYLLLIKERKGKI